MDDLNALLSSGGSTALLAIRGREVVFARGFHAHRSSVASVRKSLIGILYGIAVAAGEIDIHATLDALGIDDLSPLTAQEKQATVADLMKSRSGVYHPCVYGMEPGRPVRGSHAPGTFWYYNNWDFNALGTIYRRFERTREEAARLGKLEQVRFSALDRRHALRQGFVGECCPFGQPLEDAVRHFGSRSLGIGEAEDGGGPDLRFRIMHGLLHEGRTGPPSARLLKLPCVAGATR